MGSIDVRGATTEDAPFLRAMIWHAVTASPGLVAKVGAVTLEATEEKSWRAWAAAAPDRREPAFIALVDGVPAGAIVLKNDVLVSDEDRARRAGPIAPGVVVTRWRFGMGVEERARGRGVGRALIEHAIVFARAHGSAELALLVDAGNSRARGLYDAMGFRATGERDGAIEMRTRV